MRGRLYGDINNLPQIPKYKYSFNQKIHDLNISSPLDSKSLFSKMGRHQMTPNSSNTLPDKIKSGSNLSLEKINSSMLEYNESISGARNHKLRKLSRDPNFKLPTLKKKEENP